MLRHGVRIVAQAVPVIVAAVVLLTVLTPVSPWISVMVLCVGTAVGVLLTGGIAPELAEARLVKHGYPPGSGPRWGDRAAGR